MYTMYTMEELAGEFPWAERFTIAFADYFSKEHWKCINESTLPAQIEAKAFPGSLLKNIYLLLADYVLRPGTVVTSQDFKEYIEKIAKEVGDPNHSMYKSARFFAWLGEDLEPLLENFLTPSSDLRALDNIIEIFSSKKITDLLEGNQDALNALEAIPPELAKFEGKDARQLLRTKKINFRGMLAAVSTFTRVFPAWVGNNESIKIQANQFSDAQLNLLGRWLVPGVKDNDQLKKELLNELLNSHQIINQCTNQVNFKRLIIEAQNALLNNQEVHNNGSFQSRLAAINYKGEITPSLKCPYSQNIMNDPVTISTGITFERDSLEDMALESANPRTNELPELLVCPVTNNTFKIEELNNATSVFVNDHVEAFVQAKEMVAKANNENSNKLLVRSNSSESFFKKKPSSEDSRKVISGFNI